MWPYSIPSVSNFPIGDEINQIVCSSTQINTPAVILTATSIHLLDQKDLVLLATHKRSKESIEKYGINVKCKRNKQDDLILVKTSKSFLLVYTLTSPGNSQNDELLTVYGQGGNLLQNGVVIEESTSFFASNQLEDPIWKYQLRFKLVLKIAHGIVDFLPLDRFQWLLVTDSSVQILEVNSDSRETVSFEMEGSIKKVFNHGDLFVVVDEEKLAKLFNKKNNKFQKISDKVLQNVNHVSINHSSRLIAFQVGSMIQIFNFSLDSTIKTIEFDDEIKTMKWIGDNLFIQFSNSWSLTSTFGGIIFNSKDHDYEKDWLTNITLFDILPDHSSILLSNSTKVFHLQLLHILDRQINHNIKRPIMISGSEIRIYSGYEMSVSNSNKAVNWTIVKVPYEQSHQLPGVKHGSISQDFKYLALANPKALLIYSFIDKDWSFYINDFNHDLDISNLVWYEKLNLLILTNKTNTHSELIIFDFKKFNNEENFDSNLVIFKYDFNVDIKLLNLLGDDLIILTDNYKYYHFQIEILPTSFKIDLLKVVSFEKILNPDYKVQNIIKIDNVKNDLILLENNDVILLKEVNNSFEKLLLFDKVEFIYKIDNDNYYLYTGESLLLIKNFKNLVETKDTTNNVLKIVPSSYPVVLVQEKGLFVTLENELVNKKSIELNNIKTQNSIFLHDLIQFELQNVPTQEVYNTYHKYKNFQYALELLLYQSVINEQELSKLSNLLKINPIVELTVVPKCLRKIEMNYWETVLDKLSLSPKTLIDRSIKLKQFNTLGNLIVIFLNYENDSGKFSILNQIELENILKLVIDNANDDDALWDTASELVRFFKLLDPSRKLLQKGIEIIEQ